MSTKPNPPLNYLLPLYPGFQLLDVAGPLDILNLLSMTHAPAKDISLTIIASTLDPVSTKPTGGPLDPQTNKPRWHFPDWPVTNTQFAQTITPDVTFDSYLSALSSDGIGESSTHKPVDVLLIPGGVGSRLTRQDSETGESTSNVADLLAFIPRIAPYVRHSIVTVCTGSDILGQTGLLDSRRATTNMTRFDDVAARSPHVKWLKARRWVKSLPSDSGKEGGFHGEIWTSAGISAGIDVMFAFVAEYYGGMDVARLSAKRLEYEWREIEEGAVDPMYGLSVDEAGREVVDQS